MLDFISGRGMEKINFAVSKNGVEEETELIFARKDIMAAFKAGSGAALGMLTGLLLEFTCGLLIIAWFCSCYFLF